MLLKQLIPYKIQKNNDMNNHIRNFSDIIDKLKKKQRNGNKTCKRIY